MRFAICNETFQGWDWDRACRFAADAGYEGIEIAPFTLAEDVRDLAAADRRRIARTAVRAGLDVVGLHWLLVSPKGLGITSDDAGVRRATSDYLVALARFCGDVGGRVMVLGSPAQRRLPPAGADAAAERYCDVVRPALDAAAEAGIALCVEPLPAPEADFILNMAEADAMVARLCHPSARTILDVKSASAEGAPVADTYRRHAGTVAHVHANDANRRGPGFGETDFRPILAALDRAGYGGYVSVEVFDYSPDPETIATRSLAYLTECLP